MSGVTDKHVNAARALVMKLHGATELGQRTEWLAQALADAERQERERCLRELRDELVTIYEDSPDIDIECNNLIRRVEKGILSEAWEGE